MSKKLSFEELKEKAAPFFKKLNTEVLFASPDGCIFEEKHRAAFHCGLENVIVIKEESLPSEEKKETASQESVDSLRERLKDCKDIETLNAELKKEQTREGGERKSAITFITNLIKSLE